VDLHLESVPGFGSLTTRCLTGGNSQCLSRHTDWSLHLQLFLLGSFDQVSADLLKALNIAACECDTDSVNWHLLCRGLAVFGCKHRHVDLGVFTGRRNQWNRGEPVALFVFKDSGGKPTFQSSC